MDIPNCRAGFLSHQVRDNPLRCQAKWSVQGLNWLAPQWQGFGLYGSRVGLANGTASKEATIQNSHAEAHCWVTGESKFGSLKLLLGGKKKICLELCPR